VTLLCCPPSGSVAATFDLPLNSVIEITGDISAPVPITLLVNASSVPPYGPTFDGATPGWQYSIVVSQSNQAGNFSTPQACTTDGNCFLLGGFVGCGGDLGCGFDPLLPGYGLGRSGTPLSISISDSSRELAFSTQTSANVPFFLTLTADVPDELGIKVVALLDGSFAGVAPLTDATPLPAALPLFAFGFGAIGLLSWCCRCRRTNAGG
jgi:hypothetical protein